MRARAAPRRGARPAVRGGHGAPAPLPVKDRSFHGERGRAGCVGAGSRAVPRRAAGGQSRAGRVSTGRLSQRGVGMVGADFNAYRQTQPCPLLNRLAGFGREPTSREGNPFVRSEAGRGGEARPRRGWKAAAQAPPGAWAVLAWRRLAGS